MNKLYPDLLYEKIEDIDLALLKKQGVKGIILDIDNTLVIPHSHADERAIGFIKLLKKSGFKICIVSNNIVERAKSFADEVECDFICDGNKPSKKPFNLALEKLQLTNSSVAVVGDQIFTDIYGGNRQSMMTILVKPICNRENYFIKFKRLIEKIVLFMYKRKDK